MDSNNEAEPQGVPESAQVAEIHTLNVPAVIIQSILPMVHHTAVQSINYMAVYMFLLSTCRSF